MTRITFRLLSLSALFTVIACGHSGSDLGDPARAGASGAGASASSTMSSSGGGAGGSSTGGNAGGGASPTASGASSGATSAAGTAGAASLGGQAGDAAGGSSSAGAGQGGSMAGSAGASRGPNDIAPSSGVLLGAYVDQGQLAAREQLLDRKLAIHHRFYAWTDDWVGGELEQDVAAGRVPMATWEPHTAALPDISGGTYDEMARGRARAAKKVGKPIFLRFGHEMNGDWYAWGGPKNGNEAGPAQYIAAWRHLHDIFTDEGASNVLWVWCPNADSVPNVQWNQPSSYYPGDAYVDWVAVDGYNWGSSQSWSTWRPFKTIFDPVYASYAAMGKPFMIAETGSPEDGGDKSAWFSALRVDIKAFPAVKALVYFDTYDANLKIDFKIDSSAEALTAFAALGKDPYFNP